MDDVIGGVQEFYTGQSILLTGATGFLGKVITEKLLRTCPDIKKLFLLIRTKKGKDSEDRMRELFNDPVFDVMKKANPLYMEKVVIIPGDITLPYNGISEPDRRMLIEEVTIVFHGAATVRFDEKLKAAVNINIYGTKQMLKICSECKYLKAFVHISTAYTNCNEQNVKEEIYPPPINSDVIIKLAKCLPEEVLETCAPKILYGWPNTYVFTKQVSEDLVRSEAISKKIPTSILRPAIVIGAHSEPIPGWIDNVYGPTGVLAAAGAGILRTINANSDMKAELVPVDMVVNAALTIAWELATRDRNNINSNNEPSNSVTVYNFTSKKKPITWGQFCDINSRQGCKNPSSRSLWYYSVTLAKYQTIFFLYHFFLHLFPALLIDFILLIARKQPQAIKIYRKVQKFLSVMKYFSTKEWNFHTDNTDNLWCKLSIKDKELFSFSMDVIDWETFFENNIGALRLYIYNDPPETAPRAQRKFFVFHVLHRLIQLTFLLFVFWILSSSTQKLFNWLFSSLQVISNNEL